MFPSAITWPLYVTLPLTEQGSPSEQPTAQQTTSTPANSHPARTSRRRFLHRSIMLKLPSDLA
jgi:hypothetical protein